MDDETATKLVEAAVAARGNAYAPYSKYSVGAAVISKSGEVFVGANVENASYGLTNCAERTAIFNAVTSGVRDLKAIAICLNEGGFPCGACRQVMNEFNPDMEVIIVSPDGLLEQTTTLSQLLPNAFGPQNLK